MRLPKLMKRGRKWATVDMCIFTSKSSGKEVFCGETFFLTREAACVYISSHRASRDSPWGGWSEATRLWILPLSPPSTTHSHSQCPWSNLSFSNSPLMKSSGFISSDWWEKCEQRLGSGSVPPVGRTTGCQTLKRKRDAECLDFAGLC